MNVGMQWVDPDDLRERFTNALLIEVPGDRSDLEDPLCELVDIQGDGDDMFTILHVPGGDLPCPVTRAMGMDYSDQ